MQERALEEMSARLRKQKAELLQRLQRINENHRRPLESDSKERATQLENREVVDALGNEAREELEQIAAALVRIDEGEYGICADCSCVIADNRLRAFPQADRCVECASREEERARISR